MNESNNLEVELKNLMMKTLSGDDVSYQELLLKISNYLRFAIKKINNGNDREDIVQETLLAIHLKKHTYNQECAIPWIFSIARYKNIDFWRKTKDLSVIEWNDNVDTVDEFKILNGTELSMDELTKDLNEKQKQVITLVKIDGYSLKEAATRLNMTVSNVKVTIHRSINKIKDGIKK